MAEIKMIFDKKENGLFFFTEGKSVRESLLIRFFDEDEKHNLTTTLNRDNQIEIIKKLVANL